MHVQPGPSCLRLTRLIRASQMAGFLAIFALAGFVLFNALDVDGIATVLLASKSAAVITTPGDPDTDRILTPPLHTAALWVTSLPAPLRLATAQNRCSRTLSHIVRPRLRLIPHTDTPPAADPL